MKEQFESNDEEEANYSQHAMQEAFTQLPSTYAKQYYQHV